MITLECDNCEQSFKVEVDKAGTKVPCPACGDINRVPAAHSPESAGLPPDAGPEQQILSFRPAMVRARPISALIIVLMVIGGLAGLVAAWRADRTTLQYVGLGVMLLGVIWWAVWYVHHLAEHLTVSNKRTTYRRGLLRKHTSEVLHDHIRNLQIEQSLFQRLLNTGRITLDSAAGGGAVSAEITVDHVPQPKKIKDIIDRYRDM